MGIFQTAKRNVRRKNPREAVRAPGVLAKGMGGELLFNAESGATARRKWVSCVFLLADFRGDQLGGTVRRGFGGCQTDCFDLAAWRAYRAKKCAAPTALRREERQTGEAESKSKTPHAKTAYGAPFLQRLKPGLTCDLVWGL